VNSQAVWLSLQSSGGNVILAWRQGQLQSASQIVGPYSNLSGVTSPYTNTASGTQQFFRVKIQ